MTSEGKRATPALDKKDPLWQPFNHGWRREVVYRFTQQAGDDERRADSYYYTPTGKKLRSLREISAFLKESRSALSLAAFSIQRRPLGAGPPHESVREAGKRLSSSATLRGATKPTGQPPKRVVDRRSADGLAKAGRRVVKAAVSRVLQRSVQSQKRPSASAVLVSGSTAQAKGTSPARQPSQTAGATALPRTPRVVLKRLRPEQIPTPPVQRKTQPSRAAHSRHRVLGNKPGPAQVRPCVSQIISRVVQNKPSAIQNKPTVIQNKPSVDQKKSRVVPIKPRVVPIRPRVVPSRVVPSQPQVVMLKQVNGAAPLPCALAASSLPGAGSTLLRFLTMGRGAATPAGDPPRRKLKMMVKCGPPAPSPPGAVMTVYAAPGVGPPPGAAAESPAAMLRRLLCTRPWRLAVVDPSGEADLVDEPSRNNLWRRVYTDLLERGQPAAAAQTLRIGKVRQYVACSAFCLWTEKCDVMELPTLRCVGCCCLSHPFCVGLLPPPRPDRADFLCKDCFDRLSQERDRHLSVPETRPTPARKPARKRVRTRSPDPDWTPELVRVSDSSADSADSEPDSNKVEEIVVTASAEESDALLAARAADTAPAPTAAAAALVLPRDSCDRWKDPWQFLDRGGGGGGDGPDWDGARSGGSDSACSYRSDGGSEDSVEELSSSLWADVKRMSGDSGHGRKDNGPGEVRSPPSLVRGAGQAARGPRAWGDGPPSLVVGPPSLATPPPLAACPPAVTVAPSCRGNRPPPLQRAPGGSRPLAVSRETAPPSPPPALDDSRTVVVNRTGPPSRPPVLSPEGAQSRRRRPSGGGGCKVRITGPPTLRPAVPPPVSGAAPRSASSVVLVVSPGTATAPTLTPAPAPAPAPKPKSLLAPNPTRKPAWVPEIVSAPKLAPKPSPTPKPPMLTLPPASVRTAAPSVNNSATAPTSAPSITVYPRAPPATSLLTSPLTSPVTSPTAQPPGAVRRVITVRPRSTSGGGGEPAAGGAESGVARAGAGLPRRGEGPKRVARKSTGGVAPGFRRAARSLQPSWKPRESRSPGLRDEEGFVKCKQEQEEVEVLEHSPTVGSSPLVVIPVSTNGLAGLSERTLSRGDCPGISELPPDSEADWRGGTRAGKRPPGTGEGMGSPGAKKRSWRAPV